MEGFALDWSDVASGRLASGDCAGAVRACILHPVRLRISLLT